MGALGKNQASGPWWDRIRQVHALLNQEELPGWAEVVAPAQAAEAPKKRVSGKRKAVGS